MERIGILHLSDIHLCEENEKEIVQLLDKLNCDIDVVCQSEKFKIQAICLTGDLINKGSENASAFASFERAFLMPLLNKFHLDSNSVFIVPGNHEVDISKIDKYDIEKLLCNFDFILNGHIHTLDTKSIIAYHGQSIVSTSGRFYPSEDYYNGYSIIAIDPDTYNGGVFLRQYYPARNCFDKVSSYFIYLCNAFKEL